MMAFSFSRWTRKKDTSARAAKERLQILLAHDRAGGSEPDFLPALQKDILDVIKRHMKITNDAVDIRMERGDTTSNFEINIEVPETKVESETAAKTPSRSASSASSKKR